MEHRRSVGSLSPAAEGVALEAGATEAWRPPGPREILTRDLPHLAHSWGERFSTRVLVLMARRSVVEIRGLEHIRPECDPFVLAMNHSQRPEAILLPITLIFLRQGKTLHFLGDWNFKLIPWIGFLYRRSGVITIVRKDARPRFLNAFKRFYDHPLSASERALLTLKQGRSLGVFPEGTVNRDPDRLLYGRYGAARLSLEAQVPVVPGGIRFPEKAPGEPIRDFDRMALEIGPPMKPPADDGSRKVVASWHHQIMQAIAGLSGKGWEATRRRR